MTVASNSFKPTWYTEETHGSAWSRVKAAMRRDWEQTKNDFTPGAPDLNQDVPDTVKQAAGTQPIPPPNAKNPPGSKGEMKKEAQTMAWDDVETPMHYGYAAKRQYGTTHTAWDDKLETQLKTEWETSKTNRKWDDVKAHVRRGFDTTY